MNIKGSITISRVHTSSEDDYVEIRVEDSEARVPFLDVKMDLVNFAHVITGLGYVGCDLEVRGLEHVGKVRERKHVSFELPEGTSCTEEKATAIAMLAEIDDGWTYSTYLGTQNTFYSEGDKRCFSTWAARWVDKDETK